MMSRTLWRRHAWHGDVTTARRRLFVFEGGCGLGRQEYLAKIRLLLLELKFVRFGLGSSQIARNAQSTHQLIHALFSELHAHLTPHTHPLQ